MELTLGEEKQLTTWRETVTHVSELAHAKLDKSVHGHLERATALVLQRHVWLGEDGRHAQVLSSDGKTWYVVNGNCTCMDAPKAPQGWCKHKLAVQIYKRVGELLTSSGARPAPAAAAKPALPEAPASVHCHVLIEGHSVQVTLRDVDEERLLARLAALLTRYPAAPCGGKGETPAQTTPTSTPTCPHHGPGKESTKAPGTWYCTKKMADGSYCRWRYPDK